MSQPTPEEAARALREVSDRRAQGLRGTVHPRWVWVLAGAFLAGYLAAMDLLPEDARGWVSWAFAAVMLVYALGVRSRFASTLMGQSARANLGSVPVRPRVFYLIGLLVCTGLLMLVLHLLQVPHMMIVYGVVVGVYLSLLGPRTQAWILAAKARD
ncbi:hypothetical protein GCM10010174_05270 [Kutzneria viridogrisea]|uniref:Uncharacterized protein n=2 Tax=Kutzneria TaxID=43356 RepID=W5WAV2_9PSEU|nr:hypothetical protein [Kutzneria albida]AHH98062.1 hypothetical protein KALB_4700 [Kutzneria albida DSM 43870]MBA8924278.1 hypothetical protein [Kutzneria viridogrisea]